MCPSSFFPSLGTYKAWGRTTSPAETELHSGIAAVALEVCYPRAWTWPFCKAWINSRARSTCCTFRGGKWVCPGSAQGMQASAIGSPW